MHAKEIYGGGEFYLFLFLFQLFIIVPLPLLRDIKKIVSLIIN
jgi:hypothetical protein